MNGCETTVVSVAIFLARQLKNDLRNHPKFFDSVLENDDVLLLHYHHLEGHQQQPQPLNHHNNVLPGYP